jgi:hypothetical protein
LREIGLTHGLAEAQLQRQYRFKPGIATAPIDYVPR